MTIRRARPGDFGTIVQLIRDLAAYERLSEAVTLDPEVMREHLFGPDPAASVFLAENEGVIVGYALWFRTFSTFLGRPGIWLEDLYVDPAHRGAGHGFALLQAVRAETDGRVEWAVLDWNERSIRFYESLGAQPMEEWRLFRWAPAAR